MTDSGFEDRVRAALHQKAGDVRPADGWEAIQRKLGEAPAVPAARRARAPWLLSAAAAVVVAVVGASLALQDEGPERTVVAAGDDPGAATGEPLLDAVWPTDDPTELLSISADYVRSPEDVAAAYLSDRLDRELAPDLIEVDGDTAQLGDGTPVVVHLGQHEEAWYVQRASSGLLDVRLGFDGTRVQGEVVPGANGDLEVGFVASDGGAGGYQWAAVAEDPIAVDLGLTRRASSVVIRSTLVGDAGNAALDERRLVPGSGDWAPHPEAESEALGVWPKPVDEVHSGMLTDPVDTAALYIESTVGSSNGVVLSDFRQGDSNSGEVEVTGALVATLALRQVDGLWHVEAVHTPQVEARGDVPGELWLHANVEGVLTVTVLDSWGTVVQSMPERRMGEGEEVVVVPAEPVHKPFTVRYRFQPVAGNPVGIGDVAVAGTCCGDDQQAETEVHEVPDEAIFAGGGLDPVGTAQGYIEARLGFWPDGMHLNESMSGPNNATVDWPSGSVFLVRSGDLWYVTESVGASISFESVTWSDDDVRVDAFAGEPGVLVAQVLDAEGGVCAEARTDVERRGSAGVTLDDVPCDAESIVLTLGEVIAEQAV